MTTYNLGLRVWHPKRRDQLCGLLVNSYLEEKLKHVARSPESFEQVPKVDLQYYTQLFHKRNWCNKDMKKLLLSKVFVDFIVV